MFRSSSFPSTILAHVTLSVCEQSTLPSPTKHSFSIARLLPIIYSSPSNRDTPHFSKLTIVTSPSLSIRSSSISSTPSVPSSHMPLITLSLYCPLGIPSSLPSILRGFMLFSWFMNITPVTPSLNTARASLLLCSTVSVQ